MYPWRWAAALARQQAKPSPQHRENYLYHYGWFGAQGLGIRVQGLGFRVQGLEARVYQGLWFRVQGLKFQGLGLKPQGLGFKVQGLGGPYGLRFASLICYLRLVQTHVFVVLQLRLFLFDCVACVCVAYLLFLKTNTFVVRLRSCLFLFVLALVSFRVLRVQGLGFRVQGLGVRVQGLKVWGLGLTVQGIGFMVQEGFMV